MSTQDRLQIRGLGYLSPSEEGLIPHFVILTPSEVEGEGSIKRANGQDDNLETITTHPLTTRPFDLTQDA